MDKKLACKFAIYSGIDCSIDKYQFEPKVPDEVKSDTELEGQQRISHEE